MKPSPLSELAWQARWAAGELGRFLQTEDGRRVEIHHPGTWNREPGPDFRNARVSIGDGAPQQGDIEFDLRAADWEAHGHAANPNFENVLLHVFLNRGRSTHFSRTASHRAIPQVCLADQPSGNAWHPIKPATPPEIPANVRDRFRLLEEAAGQRLRRKAEAFRRRVAVHGAGETLYQALAAALGYKNNAVPFTILAQRVSLRQARSEAGEALLYGVGGFLDGGRFAIYSEETRRYARGLWDEWWTHRAGAARLILPVSAWRCGALRPANHPHRRLAALNLLAKQWTAVRSAFARAKPDALLAIFRQLNHPYWSRHAKLDGTRLRLETGLIGNSRAADILANVYYPWREMTRDCFWDDYLSRPAPQASTVARRAAERLFGPAHAAIALRRLAWQQGLLELRVADAFPPVLALTAPGSSASESGQPIASPFVNP